VPARSGGAEHRPATELPPGFERGADGRLRRRAGVDVAEAAHVLGKSRRTLQRELGDGLYGDDQWLEAGAYRIARTAVYGEPVDSRAVDLIVLATAADRPDLAAWVARTADVLRVARGAYQEIDRLAPPSATTPSTDPERKR
jgi:hypothetical protein